MTSPPEPAAPPIGMDPMMLTMHYEAARALAVGDTAHGHPVIGLTVLYRWGLPAWMQLVQNAPQHPHCDAPPGARASTATVSAPGADVAPTILVIASMLLAFSKESSQCMARSN